MLDFIGLKYLRELINFFFEINLKYWGDFKELKMNKEVLSIIIKGKKKKKKIIIRFLIFF